MRYYARHFSHQCYRTRQSALVRFFSVEATGGSKVKEHVVGTSGCVSTGIGASHTRHLLVVEPRGFQEDEVHAKMRTELVMIEE